MKFIHSPLKKTFIVLLSTIVLLIIVVIIFISPISKYVIEKYDEEITGREIKTAWVYVNPFTGYIYLRNLKIYESKTQTSLTSGDSVFFAAKGLGVNFSLYKLFKKTIEISDLTLTQPKGIIIQNKKKLNFSDLIQKFTIDKTVANQQKFHFNIQNIKITNGQFYYYDKVISLNYYIKDVCINSSGKNWNSDTLHASFSFLSGSTKGSANGNFTINFDNLNYRFATVIDHFDLNFLNQYFSDITIYGTFRASLDANVRATGNFNDKENINIKGLLEVNDLHIGKNPEVDFAAFNKLV